MTDLFRYVGSLDSGRSLCPGSRADQQAILECERRRVQMSDSIQAGKQGESTDSPKSVTKKNDLIFVAHSGANPKTKEETMNPSDRVRSTAEPKPDHIK